MSIFNRGCRACKESRQTIQRLIDKPPTPCVSCENYRAEVAYLREQLERVREDWQVERAEFKRAVDSLLLLAKATPVGQGPTPKPQSPPDVEALVGMFEEDAASR